jgi:soluble lytic murein transglycosylase-like protein
VTGSRRARRAGWSGALGALAVLVTLTPALAAADIWSYTDPNGVVHFTNLGPRKGWKRIYKTGPGKAAAVRGDCKGCDRVPPRDRSAERYVRFNEHIREAALLYQIPETLIRAVIRCESDFDPSVVSRAGARGLMQLMPSAQQDMRVADVWDPRQNVLGGTRLLRVLANRFAGDLVRTIASYHAGAGAVERYGGVPPYETTRLYLKMVLQEYYDLRAKEARAAAVAGERPHALAP